MNYRRALKTTNTLRTKRVRQNTLPRLMFLSDEARVKNPVSIVSALPKRCGIILRDYANPKRNELIKTIINKTKNSTLILFLANRGAEKYKNLHNEHWPNTGRGGQRRKTPTQLITTSAHNLSDVGRANRLNIDAVLISPIFATKSHKDAKPLNIHRFVRLARLSKTPVYALGGLSLKSITHLKKHKLAHGFAGISLFKKQTRH